jgi:hypothetical protein
MCCLDVDADTWGPSKPLFVSVRNWPTSVIPRPPLSSRCRANRCHPWITSTYVKGDDKDGTSMLRQRSRPHQAGAYAELYIQIVSSLGR